MGDSSFKIHLYKIDDSHTRAADLQVSVYRLDLVRPNYSGNKYYKLLGLAKYLQQYAQAGVVSFGGVWSNHLLALSQYGRDNHIPTVGLVRGDDVDTDVISTCRLNGMDIQTLTPSVYRQRNQPEQELKHILERWPNYYVLPEGGADERSIAGCEAIAQELDALGEFDQIIVPVGTGATLAGILRANLSAHIYGVAATKKYAQQRNFIEQVVGPQKSARFSMVSAPEFGGFGRLSEPVKDFIAWFETTHAIPLDPNYTAKSFFWFYEAMRQNKFKAGQRVVLLHTGGLIGRRGFPDVFANACVS